MCTHGRVSFFAYNFHKSCVNMFNKGDNFSLFKFIGIVFYSGENDEYKCDIAWTYTDHVFILRHKMC